MKIPVGIGLSIDISIAGEDTLSLIWSDGKTTTTAVSEPRTPGTQKYCGRVLSVTIRQLVNPDYSSGRKWLSLKMARTLHKSKK